MMPDSVIADAASQPEDTLDLSQMLGAPRTPNPAQVAQAKGNAWKEFAPILAMLPIVAAKGGRVGVAAMLSGLERSQREREAQQMRAEQMGMQRQQFDATQQARQQAIQASADQQRQRMAQELLRDLASGLQGAEDEQQAQQFIDAMLPAIQQAGIPMGRIEAMRMQLAAPDRLRAKKAKKALDAVLATTPKENLGDVRVDLDGDGNALGIDELTAVANQASGVRINRTQRAPEPKPVTFSNNLEEVVVNGQPTLVRAGSDGKLYDANGGLVTGRVTAKPAQSGQGTPKPVDQEWVIRNGQVIPIPKGTRQVGDKPYDSVAAKQMGGGNAQQARQSMSADALQLVREIKSSPGLAGAFGAPALTQPGSWQRLLGLQAASGSASADTMSRIDRLKALLTIPRLQELRGLGAMSDREFSMLSAAATTLQSGMSDKSAVEELDRLERVLSEMTAAPMTSGQSQPIQNAPSQPMRVGRFTVEVEP